MHTPHSHLYHAFFYTTGSLHTTKSSWAWSKQKRFQDNVLLAFLCWNSFKTVWSTYALAPVNSFSENLPFKLINKTGSGRSQLGLITTFLYRPWLWLHLHNITTGANCISVESRLGIGSYSWKVHIRNNVEDIRQSCWAFFLALLPCEKVSKNVWQTSYIK